jgi:hypothetical protein
MNLALVFTAALIIFAEKTLPDSHRIARPLGVLMMMGGVAFLGFSLLGGTGPGAEPGMEDMNKPEIPGMEDDMENME